MNKQDEKKHKMNGYKDSKRPKEIDKRAKGNEKRKKRKKTITEPKNTHRLLKREEMIKYKNRYTFKA